MTASNKDLEAKVVDVYEWDHEESTIQRDLEKKKMIAMIGTSVIANKGNVGMVKKMLRKGATDSKNYKCHSSFLCFSMGQDDKKQGVTPLTMTGATSQ